MKSILISIQPKWCELIANGHKTIEVRKTKPKIDVPFKCYIYCTKSKSKYLFRAKVRECYHDDYGHMETWVTGYDELQKEYYKNALNGKVIGEFVCDEILYIQSRGVNHNYDYCFESLNVFGNDDIEPYITAIKKSCVSKKELNEYGNNTYYLYAWHISDLVIYDKPRELSEFFHYCGDNPKCDGCKARYFSNTECGKEDYCCSVVEGCKPITRPPQSYCYIESEEK